MQNLCGWAGKHMQIEVNQEVTLGTERKLEYVKKFCYLGDMFGASRGADEASRE